MVDNVSPTTYFFRVELVTALVGIGGTVQIGFDCNNNNSFDDPGDDLVLNYWVAYEDYEQLSAVWTSTPDGILLTEFTDAYGETVGNNYELRADTAALCPSNRFGVIFKVAYGADAAVPITYPLPDVALVLDDGASEDGLGYLFDSNALQFLWLNRFTPPTTDFPFALDRVNVQWVAEGSGSAIGDAVDVYIWEDADGDPANGALFRGSTSGIVQTTSGDFSTYLLTPPILFCNPTDVLIGVVDRLVISYTTGPKWPARIDTHSVTSNRSWIATYATDPGSPPTLPAEGYDPLTNGTWMIRGYGATVPLTACGIPEVTLNYNTGAPGSFFEVAGAGFPANDSAAITVNNHVLGNIVTDGNGDLSFLLSTDNSDEGMYFVTVSVNPQATTHFSVDLDAPVRPQAGNGPVFAVPEGIALTEFSFLPVLHR
ncbi:MAG: hypothetical protein HND44_24100 [Chloroflexi bacterium]|nr:hypothetical protein [Ardenticatenaceae bacterium]MBL1131511.1 hypothetical protein [Chloroflexota bacterium]NOG37622.1 hypothetical protein [Chloroflexota bacterium]